MNLDWQHFTPWQSLFGGILLGIAAAMFILLNGRILGVSGILGGLLTPRQGDVGWRMMFLFGIFSSPFLFSLLSASTFSLEPKIEASFTTIVLAGLLVGFGTRYGSGCTSGHGVCGLSRLSPRSLVSTISFMGFGFLVVYFMRHFH